MAKKLSSKVGLYCLGGIVLSAVVIFVMMFLTAVSKTVTAGDTSSTTAYSGMQVAFGAELSSANGGSLFQAGSKIDFSFWAMLAYLLPLVAGVLAGVFYLIKKQNAKIIVAIVCAVVFVFAAIMLFIMPSVTSITASANSSLLGGATSSTSSFADMEFGLGVGSIIGGIFAVIGALCSCGYAVSK